MTRSGAAAALLWAVLASGTAARAGEPAARKPTPAASATPPSLARPKSTPKPYERFVVGDYLITPKIYDRYDARAAAGTSFRASATSEFPLFGLPWMIQGDYRSYRYDRALDPGDATTGSALAHDNNVDARLGLKLADPRVYVGVGYLVGNSTDSLAAPSRRTGLGVGLQKLADVDRPLSVFGSVYYYPQITTSANGDLTNAPGSAKYRFLKYDLGLHVGLGPTPGFLEAGYLGDRGLGTGIQSDVSHNGPYAGLGFHF